MSENSHSRTKVERRTDCEIVVTRTFDAPPRIVFTAWTTPELFRRWWAPKSLGMSMVACDMDVRTGGGYRIAFSPNPAMEFFGKYIEVVPNERLVWTNEEDENAAVTTVTFEDQGGRTLVTMSELYASKEALEAAGGAEGATPEQFAQLDALLEEIGAAA